MKMLQKTTLISMFLRAINHAQSSALRGLIVVFSALAVTAPLIANAQSSAPERAINASVIVKASVADVYKTFTTTAGVKTFFAPDAVVEPVVGGLFEMHMNPLAAPGDKGGDGMRFLALQENKMISFTWNAPPSLPEARKQRTMVIVRFVEKGDKETEVKLHHVGWGDGGEWDKTYDYFARAWPNVLNNLKKRFDEGPVDWTAWMERMRGTKAPAPAK
jgi:uncharacterized protein YndB with AHSA1/START domain